MERSGALSSRTASHRHAFEARGLASCQQKPLEHLERHANGAACLALADTREQEAPSDHSSSSMGRGRCSGARRATRSPGCPAPDVPDPASCTSLSLVATMMRARTQPGLPPNVRCSSASGLVCGNACALRRYFPQGRAAAASRARGIATPCCAAFARPQASKLEAPRLRWLRRRGPSRWTC